MNQILSLGLFSAICCLVFCVPTTSSSLFDGDGNASPDNLFTQQLLTDTQSNQCFCELNDGVDDCECKIESIDKFNNYKIFPRVKTLVQKDYFRYIKVNLNKACEFWPPNDGKCAQKDCHVEFCSEEDLPKDFKTYFENDQNHNSQEVLDDDDDNDDECEESNPLGHLNQTLSDENLERFNKLEKFDDAQYNFCEPDDESLEDAEFADLVANPERFTGYKGAHAHKIWNSIYNENCFGDTETVSPYGPEIETCLEKRVFYRLISGLHASINIHLTARYLHQGHLNQPDYWGPNVREFKRRFNPGKTNGQGPQWLKNLYFLYLVELRAITKAASYFERETFYAGRSVQSDQETKQAVMDFLQVTKGFESHFDERSLFRSNTKETLRLREQFQLKFRNITKIMDCVGCDKCKLWGKVQTRSLGTALKILFYGPQPSLLSGHETAADKFKPNFQLSRVEIVALFNGFARLSESINEIEEFRELIAVEAANKDPSRKKKKKKGQITFDLK